MCPGEFRANEKPLAIPLDWEGGAVLGFVTAPNTEPKVLAYAEYIRSHLQPIQNFWTPLG